MSCCWKAYHKIVSAETDFQLWSKTSVWHTVSIVRVLQGKHPPPFSPLQPQGIWPVSSFFFLYFSLAVSHSAPPNGRGQLAGCPPWLFSIYSPGHIDRRLSSAVSCDVSSSSLPLYMPLLLLWRCWRSPLKGLRLGRQGSGSSIRVLHPTKPQVVVRNPASLPEDLYFVFAIFSHKGDQVSTHGSGLPTPSLTHSCDNCTFPEAQPSWNNHRPVLEPISKLKFEPITGFHLDQWQALCAAALSSLV